jgi:hypothetical protein
MGGQDLGKTTKIEIEGHGKLIFTYMRDPEGNITEIQQKQDPP